MTSCRQQWRSYIRRGIKEPNPKALMLKELGSFIQKWSNLSPNHLVLLMMDSNEELKYGSQLHNFTLQNNLVDAIETLNPAYKDDKTYIHGSTRIDHIFLSPELAEIALKAGHHQFHQHFMTDHKGVYVHFHADDFFESPKIDKTHFSFRALRLDRRDIVEKYIEELKKIYKDNKFIERMDKAVDKIEKATTKEERTCAFQYFDRLDLEREQYMRAAEKKAGVTRKTGTYEWSPTLEKSGQQVTYWKLRMYKSKGGDIAEQRLQQYREDNQIQDSNSNEIKYIKQRLSEAWQQLRKTQKQSESLREDYLEELAQFYANKQQTSKEIEIKKLIHQEQVSKMAVKHKWYLKPRHGMIQTMLVHDFKRGVILPIIGVICIVIFLACIFQTTTSSFLPSKQQNIMLYGIFPLAVGWGTLTDWDELIAWDGWRTINSEEILNKMLIRQNTTHLTMSDNTPFAEGPAATSIGLDGEGDEVEDILMGKSTIYNSNSNNSTTSLEKTPELKAFVTALQRSISTRTSQPIPEIDPEITEEQYKNLFNKTKEATASFPPLHYGHFKAACESNELTKVNVTFRNIPSSMA